MTDDGPKLDFLKMTDEEKSLFCRTLELNKHLNESHYIQLFAWCKLSLKIANINGDLKREDLRFLSEYRLLSNALRLLPGHQANKQVDFAAALQEVVG